MIPLVAIGLITIVIASLVLINDSISNQQELAQINHIVQQKNIQITSELINIQAVNLGDTIEFINTQNEEIHIIQIRVYDVSGNYVKSFDVDYVIHGNNSIEILSENLPAELQGMLIQ